jgi:hypothetical protein
MVIDFSFTVTRIMSRYTYITKGSAEAKYWLLPVLEEVYSYGYKLKERKEIRILINENADKIITKWNEFFK